MYQWKIISYIRWKVYIELKFLHKYTTYLPGTIAVEVLELLKIPTERRTEEPIDST